YHVEDFRLPIHAGFYRRFRPDPWIFNLTLAFHIRYVLESLQLSKFVQVFFDAQPLDKVSTWIKTRRPVWGCVFFYFPGN
ncbi:hypothetical protein C2E25_12945, partial [Geothermobacter hydrogeniphilus]